MGAITSKVEKDKVVSVTIRTGKDFEQTKTDNDEPTFKKYKDFLNKDGFIIVKINLKVLTELLTRIYDKLELTDPPPHIKEFKNNIKINDSEVGPMYKSAGLLGLGIGSMSGFYTIVESGIFSDLTKLDKINGKDPSINILFPKVLISNNKNDFLDFIFNDINKYPPKARKLVDTILNGVNKKSSKGDVRLANLINLTFNSGLILGLSNFFTPFDPKNIPLLIAELIAETISSFPDDNCYFSNESIISFDPNVCNIPKTPEKIEAQKAVACPEAKACPVAKEKECPEAKEKECPKSNILLISCIILHNVYESKR